MVTSSIFKQDIANFLYKNHLLQLILAVYLGTVLQDFFNNSAPLLCIQVVLRKLFHEFFSKIPVYYV